MKHWKYLALLLLAVFFIVMIIIKIGDFTVSSKYFAAIEKHDGIVRIDNYGGIDIYVNSLNSGKYSYSAAENRNSRKNVLVYDKNGTLIGEGRYSRICTSKTNPEVYHEVIFWIREESHLYSVDDSKAELKFKQ